MHRLNHAARAAPHRRTAIAKSPYIIMYTYVRRFVWTQGAFLFAHYCLLAALVPLPVAIGHVFLGGWLTATIVTVTHTAEEFSVKDQPPLPSSSSSSSSSEGGEAREPSYVETQFKTTRDAVCGDPLSE